MADADQAEADADDPEAVDDVEHQDDTGQRQR
jgi:hypothetical protein